MLPKGALMSLGTSVEAETDGKLTVAFMESVIVATRRFMRVLVWERVVDGIYSAWWKSGAIGLFFIHKSDVYQLYVVDKSKLHETLVFDSAEYGWQLQGQLEQLEIAINNQLVSAPPCTQKLATDKAAYLDYVIKSFF